MRTGAALLDMASPGWRDDLRSRLLADVRALDFGDPDDGVLTVLFGSHERGVREIFRGVPVEADRAVLSAGCGFEGCPMEVVGDYEQQVVALAELWTSIAGARIR
ncbi:MULTISPECIES: hypothetical protein [Actinomycetes]|uniref:hypothetical protein n=1 Tax=Actinomycetes TaxID=1760 RepID=UPI001319D993|nr:MULTISPECIES: hypothetical protein [Actinomycetes]